MTKQEIKEYSDTKFPFYRVTLVDTLSDGKNTLVIHTTTSYTFSFVNNEWRASYGTKFIFRLTRIQVKYLLAELEVYRTRTEYLLKDINKAITNTTL